LRDGGVGARLDQSAPAVTLIIVNSSLPGEKGYLSPVTTRLWPKGDARGCERNPGGRPKVVAEVKELARKHTGKAIETLVSIMDNPKTAPAARVSAANALLDRGYGKPPQHITGEGGPSFVVRLPEPVKNAEEWLATVNKPMLVSQPLADDGHVGDNPLNTNDNDEDSTS